MPAIVGLVRHQPSGKPIPGARVRAYDRDDQTNDLIGEAVTAAEGGFEIAGDDAAFAEFVDDSPDVVIDVELPNGRTLSARRDLRWSAGKLLPVAGIETYLPRLLKRPANPNAAKARRRKAGTSTIKARARRRSTTTTTAMTTTTTIHLYAADGAVTPTAGTTPVIIRSRPSAAATST